MPLLTELDPSRVLFLQGCRTYGAFFALLSVRIIVRREDFLLRDFPPRLGPESDRQAMCNLLLHMQQKVVIGLVAALPRCASPRLGVKKFSRGYQLDKVSLRLLNRPAVKCLSRLAKSFVGRSTRSGLLLSVLVLTNPASALAQEVTCVLVSPSQPLTAGTRGGVWLYCQNNSSNEVRRTFEPNLDGTLTSGSNSFKTVLVLTNRSGIEATIAPGSFVKQEYRFDVPPTLGGQVTLDASNYNQVVILVKNNPAGTPATLATPATPPATNAAPRSWSWSFSADIFTVTSRFIFSWASTPAPNFSSA